jgi:hypothetical protein
LTRENFENLHMSYNNQQQSIPAECSNSSSSKAAGESKPEADPQGYVEDFDKPRTKLEDCLSVLQGTSCNLRHH